MNPRKVSDPVILFGNLEENFYQLGLRDRENGKIVHDSVKSMLKTPIKPLNKLMEEVGVSVIKNTLLKDKDRYPHLKAYAEGLNQNLENVFYMMLIPELVSGMTKWAPGLVKSQFGCSSFFMRNEKHQMVHGRILDFPLQNTYDQFERVVLYSLKGMPKTLAYNCQGIPYPSITAMTESGMTIALHQKFTNIFNTKGESIFEIIFDLIKNVDNRKDAIEFLQKKKSLTTWCLYIGFQNGDILAYDIMGEDAFYNLAHLDDQSKQVIYFCNHLENKSLNQTDFLPLGFHEYNCMRESTAHQKIKEFEKKNHYSDFDLLKMMSNPYKTKSKKYQTDNITNTSIAAVCMNVEAQSSHFVAGAAPKIYQNNIFEIKDTFRDPVANHIEDKKYKNQNEEYYKGLHALTNAQKGFDDADPKRIYHELQFAIDHLENYPDQLIAHFYFLVAQYLYESHAKVHSHLLREFKKLSLQFEGYLKEQCLIFIFRLETILSLPITLEMDLIKTKQLKDIIELERKIPRPVFHLTTKLMSVPRIDILDVIYVYTH